MTCCVSLAQITKLLSISCHHLSVEIDEQVSHISSSSLVCSVSFVVHAACSANVYALVHSAFGLVLPVSPCPNIWRV